MLLAVQILLGGLMLGGVYACMAAGFSLAWGVAGIVNLAYGTMAIAGGYVAFLAQDKAGIDPLPMLPLAFMVLSGAGYALHRIVLHRLVSRSVVMTLILTFGLNMLLMNGLLAAFSADFHGTPTSLVHGALRLGQVRLPWARLLVFAIAATCLAVLTLFLQRSRTGQAIQAAAQNPNAARILGIDARHTYALAFGISTGLAGAAGVLLGMLYPFSPLSGDSITMKAFVIVVLGGLGSIPGALAGGMLLGVVENAASAFMPGYRDAAGFLVLLLVLLLRPNGLSGQTLTANTARFPTAPLGEAPAWLAPVLFGGLALLLALPLMLDNYWLRVAATVFKYAAMAQGLNIIAGYTGYAALGNVVFFGLGAYGSAAMALLVPGIAWWQAMALGCLVAPAVALVTGPALLRLNGHVFAIATLGLNLAVRELVANVDWLGGGGGLTMPVLPWAPDQTAKIFYALFLAVMLLSTLTVRLFAGSRLGLICQAVRDDEAKAVAMGLPTEAAKRLAWAISAMIAGLVGSIDAWWITFIDPPASFDMGLTVTSFVALLLGGAGTVLGPLAGTAFVELAETLTWSHLLSWHLGAMGALVMAAVLLAPTGWADALHRIRGGAKTPIKAGNTQ